MRASLRGAARQKVCAPSPTTRTGGSTTTSTTKPAGAVCTGTAIVAALAPGAPVQSFVCSGSQRAAGSLTNGQKFILNGASGSWKIPSTDVCSGGAADLPDVINTAGCLWAADTSNDIESPADWPGSLAF